MNHYLGKGLIAATLAAALSNVAIAADEGAVLDRLEALEKAMQKLQAENQELKKSLDSISTEEMAEELGYMEERIDEIETMALTDKINFGLGFENRVDNHKKEFVGGGSFSDNANFSSKLWLNMDAKITDNMIFNGRATMYKYWSDSDVAFENSNAMLSMMGQDTEQSPAKWDYSQGRVPSSSALYIDRAYLDWVLTDAELPVILTIGRQPATDGPSYEFKENTVRKATYPALFLDAPQDGIVSTFRLDKMTDGILDSFRVGYGKAFQAHSATYTGSEYQTITGEALEDAAMMGLFLEGNLPSLEDSMWMLSYIQGGDMPADPTNSAVNENIGDLKVYGLSAQATNIKGSGLDLFAHVGFSEVSPNGKTIPMNGMNLGLMTFTPGDTETKEGQAFWVGARYAPKFIPGLKVGYEYNHGDKNWFSFLFGPNEVTNKLATRGDAHEIYAIYDVNRYAYLQAGALHIDYDYTGSGSHLGSPMDVDQVPGALDTHSNYYFMLSLLY